MRHQAVACDYDGTLAPEGLVDAPTVAAVERLRASGRRFILVTGRELDDIATVFEPAFDVCDQILSENGAVLYTPSTGEEEPLAGPPPDQLISELRARAVDPVLVGRVVVATRDPHEAAAREAIAVLGLNYQVILNKGAIMMLPPGLDKAMGLTIALDRLGIPPSNTVGVGDAENDHTFLRLCGCSVAVANALPMIRDQADIVTAKPGSEGVRELIERLIANDLANVEPARRPATIPSKH